MSKIIITKILILCLFILKINSSTDLCQCGNNQVFDQQQWQCKDYPGAQNDQYVMGCQEYALVKDIQNDVKFQCISCKPTFYFDVQNSTCIQTQLEGCDKIKRNTSQKSMKSYDKEQTQLRTLKQEDEEYTCEGCIPHFYYQSGDKCIRIPKTGQKGYIDHCNQYILQQGSLICQECKPGYFVNQINKCSENPSQDNCLQFQLNQDGEAICVQCEPHFMVGKDNQCVLTQEQIKYCQKSKYEADNDQYICLECDTGYWSDLNQCIQNPEKEGEYGKYYIENCQEYTLQNDAPTCYKCEGARGYSSKKKQCVDADDDIQGCKYYTYLEGHVNCSACFEKYAPIGVPIRECRECPFNKGNLIRYIGLLLAFYIFLI